jgi:hypothetical protein
MCPVSALGCDKSASGHQRLPHDSERFGRQVDWASKSQFGDDPGPVLIEVPGSEPAFYGTFEEGSNDGLI